MLACTVAAVTLMGAAATASSDPPTTHRRLDVAAAIPVGGVPSSIEAAAGAVWVSTGVHGVVRIERARNRIVGRIRPAGAVIGLAAGFGALWAIDVLGDRLLRIDPHTNRVTASIEVGRMPTGLAVGHGRVWVESQLDSSVAAIDPRTGRIAASRRFAYGELWPGGLAVAPDGVWVVTARGTQVTRLDERTLSVVRQVAVIGARTLATAAGALWVGRAGDKPLVRIDPNAVTELAVPSGHVRDGRGPALAADTSVWVAGHRRLRAYEATAGALELDLPLPTSGRAGAIAVAGDLWVADDDSASVLRVRRPVAGG